MTRSRHRVFGETLAVFSLLGALQLAVIVAPPDPFLQIRYVAAGLAVSIVGATVLVYGRDYRRIRLTFDGLTVVWLATLLFVAPVQMAVGPPATPLGVAVTTAALTAGLVVGIWFAYHDGLSQVRASLS